MIKLRLTKKTQKKLGLKKSVDSIETEAFMTWYVNDFKDSRRTGLIFMNGLTRYSVIVFGLRKSDFDNIEEIFMNQLKTNLISLGIDELRIKRYMKEFDSFTIDDTNDRSILGSITDHLKLLSYYVEDEDTERSDTVNSLNNRVNTTSIRSLKKAGFDPFPDDAMIKVLKDR